MWGDLSEAGIVMDFRCPSVFSFSGLSLDGSTRIGPFFHGGGSGDFVGETLLPYIEAVVLVERRVGVPSGCTVGSSSLRISFDGLPFAEDIRGFRGDRRGVTCNAVALK